MKSTITYAAKLAKLNDGYCLSDEYINLSSKLKWKCKYGHEWFASLVTIRNGSWCKKCFFERSKNTIEDAIRLAKLNDGYCLSEQYENNHTKLLWQCKLGHIWKASYLSVKNNNWCPHCAGNARLTLNDFVLLVEKRRGKCLDLVYKNSTTKMNVICEFGHEFYISYSNLRSGKWCYKCYRNSRKNTIEDATRLAKKNNGLCLSTKYLNNNTKLLWKCQNGHIWEATFRNIVSGYWCPFCNKKGGVQQNKLAKILAEILNTDVKQNYRGFGWLINDDTSSRLEIDIWIPKLKLAVEYDGKQHFKPVRFGGMSHKKARAICDNIKKLDKIKNEKILGHPKLINYFIRFNYKEKINKKNVLLKLKQKGLLI